jgi:hypothetical protein
VFDSSDSSSTAPRIGSVGATSPLRRLDVVRVKGREASRLRTTGMDIQLSLQPIRIGGMAIFRKTRRCSSVRQTHVNDDGSMKTSR